MLIRPLARFCFKHNIRIQEFEEVAKPVRGDPGERVAPVIYRNAQHTFGDDNKGGISTHATINEHILPY